MNNFGNFHHIKDSELELMRGWRNAPAVRANMYTSHEISVDEHQAWWSRTRAREDQRYFMYEKDDQKIGIVSFSAIDFLSRNCSWAFYAAPEAPRGSGSRMEFLAIDYVFNELKMHKMYCEVLDFNKSVIKLHQKFGFQVEGVFRQQHRSEIGFSDVYRLGMLADEWAVKRIEMMGKLSSK